MKFGGVAACQAAAFDYYRGAQAGCYDEIPGVPDRGVIIEVSKQRVDPDDVCIALASTVQPVDDGENTSPQPLHEGEKAIGAAALAFFLTALSYGVAQRAEHLNYGAVAAIRDRTKSDPRTLAVDGVKKSLCRSKIGTRASER